MRATAKDIIRTIGNGKKRFLSIMVITALGVTMLTGLAVGCIDLRYSADALYDEQKLFDIQVSSTLGLDDDDIEALLELDEISAAEGEYSDNVYTDIDGATLEAELHTMGEQLNIPTVLEGRLPEAADEIAVNEAYLNDTGKSVGDTLTFEEVVEEDGEAVFLETEYTITAVVINPFDVNNAEGSVSFRSTASVDYIFFVTWDAADTDVYTAVYLAVEGAEELLTYDDDYAQLIKAAEEQIDTVIKEARQQARYETIYNEAMDEYTEAEEDALAELADAQQEIDDGWEELADGQEELDDGISQLTEEEADAKEQIADGYAQIANGIAQLDEAEEELEASKEELTDGEEQLAAAAAQLAETKEETLAQLADGIAQITDALAQVEDGIAQIEEQSALLEEQAAQVEEQSALLEEQLAALTAQIETLEERLEALYALTGESEETEQLESAIAQLESTYAQILESEDVQQLYAAVAEIEVGREEIAAQLASLQATQSELEAQLAELTAQQTAAEEQFATAEAEIAAQQAEIDAGWVQIAEGEAEIAENRATLEESYAELVEQEAEAEAEIAEAWEDIYSAEEELADGEQELIDGQEELDEAREEALAELADAKAEIDDIETAKWYIQSRSSLSGYSNVDSDATSIEGLAAFLPIIFFVVAILISLTTITRMVEEERGLIGTYKALGFKNSEIRRKYLIYAAAASIAGGILGDFCGIVVLPKILFIFFHMMYMIQDYYLCFSWSYALIGIVLFMAGVLIAVGAAVRTQLIQMPATLMRPLAPKEGSRIFLERIPFIWKKLSFLNKVTARNLFRYKKRLLMTVIGIMGCTGLLVCGFSIKDTVTDLMPKQYENISRYDILAVSLAEDNDSLVSYMDDEEYIEAYINIQVETVDLSNADGEEQQVQIFVIPDDGDIETFIKLADTDGNEISLAADGILLTHSAAVVLDLSEGDTAWIQDLSMNTAEVSVAAVTEHYLGNMIYISASYYEEVFGEEYEPNAVLVNLTENCTGDDAVAYAKELGAKDGVISMTSTQTLKDEFALAFQLINLVVYVILVLAAALAFVVLFALATTNISERERELATIKVLGFYDREVHLYVNKETLILSGIGIVLGLPVGFWVSSLLQYVLKIPGLYFAVSIHKISYLYCAVTAFVFALIVNQITNRLLNRIDPVEALKSIE